MIESPTVFVLGAGAHCSYGFPSGEQLKGLVSQAVQDSLRQSQYESLLLMPSMGTARDEEVQPDRCKAFAHALSNAGQASIDAFLNANRHQLGFQTIGKAGIAQVLLKYENTDILESDDDWLNYVFRILLDGISSPSEFTTRNNISFITFNYDRLLESWLHHRIKYSFGIEDDPALQILREIPIYHVYGMLGQFPITDGSDPTAWIRASNGIRTIFDVDHDEPVITAAKEVLSKAHSICLLGFGFHRENIEILNLVSYARACEGVVASSCYDIRKTEWQRVTRPFQGVRIINSQYPYKCLEALRELPVF